jgi:hypothetical protein
MVSTVCADANEAVAPMTSAAPMPAIAMRLEMLMFLPFLVHRHPPAG